jgi:hypothetical protein
MLLQKSIQRYLFLDRADWRSVSQGWTRASNIGLEIRLHPGGFSPYPSAVPIAPVPTSHHRGAQDMPAPILPTVA